MRTCVTRHRPQSIAIVGGGLAGLSAAYYARTAFPTCAIHLFEKQDRLGGWVHSNRHQLADGANIVLESGPRSIRPRGPHAHLLLNMIHKLQLQDELLVVKSNTPAAKNRYIYTQHGLEEMPSSLLSLLGKVRHARWRKIFGEIWSDVQKWRTSERDESVDQFMRRRFGPEVANLASAMVHGIYAADSDRLSVRAAFPALWEAEAHHFNVLTGLISQGRRKKAPETVQTDTALISAFSKTSIYTLKNGLETLIHALQNHLESSNVKLHLNANVNRIVKEGDQMRIVTDDQEFVVDHVVSAVPSNVVSAMIEQPSIFLKRNPMTSVGVVSVVYDDADLVNVSRPQGFGYLVPRGMEDQSECLGVVFDSDAFQVRAPGKTILTVMLGGPYWTGRQFSGDDAQELPELEKQALKVLEKQLKIPNTTKVQFIQAQLQKNCIPTYGPGHLHRTAHLHRHFAKHYDGRLSLIGASYAGVSLNDVVQSASSVVAYLEKSGCSTGLESFSAYLKELE